MEILELPLTPLWSPGCRKSSLLHLMEYSIFNFQDFKKETGLQYTLYCDPEREIYTALHLGTDYTPVDLNSKSFSL